MIRRFKKLRSIILAGLVCAGLVIGAAMQAHAALLVMPIWIIFKDRDRTANITLVNTGGKEAVYKIGWRYQKQTESGAYEILENSEGTAFDISKMVLYSPRQVTLLAGGKQRIRLSLRRPPDLADGEYRAHLALTRMASSPDAEELARKNLKSDKIQLSLGTNVGYSLPVIIRQGSYDVAAKVEKFEMVPAEGKSPRRVKVTLSRTGKHGVFGKLTLYWTPPGGAEQEVGILNNVNIFPELTSRYANVPIKDPGISLSGGSLRIIYEGSGPDKGISLDEKTFPLGG